MFITTEGRVKILDFGLAKLMTRAVGAGETQPATAPPVTEVGVVMGTVGYMSPEQVRGLPTDSRSDIFSFGTVLFEMLAGRRPFRGDTTADTLSAILREDPPALTPRTACRPCSSGSFAAASRKPRRTVFSRPTISPSRSRL